MFLKTVKIQRKKQSFFRHRSDLQTEIWNYNNNYVTIYEQKYERLFTTSTCRREDEKIHLTRERTFVAEHKYMRERAAT